MRNYLVLLVIVAMIAAVGCGGKKKVVKKYPAGTSPSASQKNTSPPLGRTGGPVVPETKADDSAEDDSKAADDTADAADASDGDSTKEPAAAIAPPKKRRYIPGRRRIPSMGRAGGGTVTENAPKIEEPPKEEETKSEEEPAANNQAPPAEETAPEEKRKTLYDRAVKAFINQHENEAFQYLYAHAIVEDNALADHPISWYAGLKEPRMGLRWGVAIEYISGKFEGDPPVIGDPVAPTSSRGGGGGAGNDLGAGGGSARSISGAPGGNPNTDSDPDALEDPQEQLAYYTGDFGKLFIERYEMRRKHPDSFYGDALKSIDLDATFDDDVEEVRQPDPPSGGNAGDDTIVSSGSRSAGGGRNNRRDNSRDSDEEKPEYEADSTSLTAGVMLVGVGKKAAMLEAAKTSQIDLLVVFTVKVTHSESRNTTKSTTQARLISVKTGEELAATKVLNNIAVARKREGGGDDPVEVELDKIFNQVTDVHFKSDSLPDALEKYASPRVDEILGQEYTNPLPPLVEVKTYHERGWINQAEYVAAVETLIGEDKAKRLLDGEVEDREDALKKWLPGQFDMGPVTNFR